MKRVVFLFSIALLTFIAGTVASWSYQRIFPVSTFSAEPMAEALPDRLQIDSYRFVKISGRPYVEFHLTNGGPEPVYYYGYSKTDTTGFRLRRGHQVENPPRGICGTGLDKYSLRSGESTTFMVDLWDIQERLPDDSLKVLPTEEFNVGFDFLTGPERQSQTTWSGDIKVGNYFDRPTFFDDER